MDQELTSYKQRRTLPCREEEAVSVLVAPILEKALEGAARRANSEAAGRARLVAERANTIVNVGEESLIEIERKKAGGGGCGYVGLIERLPRQPVSRG